MLSKEDNSSRRKTLIAFCIAVVLLIIVIMICRGIKSTTHNKQQRVYSQAIECLENNNPDKAKKLFSSLPSDFQYSQYSLSPSQWIEEIDQKFNSPFLGFWSSGTYYTLEITQRISVYGIDIDYHKEVKDGVLICEGYLNIDNASSTNARLGSSKSEYYYESGAYNYTLILKDENTMDVYFQGDFHITLSKTA